MKDYHTHGAISYITHNAIGAILQTISSANITHNSIGYILPTIRYTILLPMVQKNHQILSVFIILLISHLIS